VTSRVCVRGQCSDAGRSLRFTVSGCVGAITPSSLYIYRFMWKPGAQTLPRTGFNTNVSFELRASSQRSVKIVTQNLAPNVDVDRFHFCLYEILPLFSRKTHKPSQIKQISERIVCSEHSTAINTTTCFIPTLPIPEALVVSHFHKDKPSPPHDVQRARFGLLRQLYGWRRACMRSYTRCCRVFGRCQVPRAGAVSSISPPRRVRWRWPAFQSCFPPVS
jgi:hypothetical protein